MAKITAGVGCSHVPAIGVAMDNLAVGIAIGVALGAGLGSANEKRRRGSRDGDAPEDDRAEASPDGPDASPDDPDSRPDGEDSAPER